ncbi:GWxTD domain-containing protein [Calditrichota bacterium GD2]
MKRKLISALMIFVLPALVLAQMNFVPINVDYASFKETDSSSYVEVYVSIFQGNLIYKALDDSTFQANFTSHLEIFDTDGNLLKSFSHNLKNTAQDTAQMNRYNQFVDIFPLSLPYGNYKAKVQLTDNVSNRSGEYIFDLNTIRPKDELFLSDLEFCMNLKKAESKDRFYKNGLYVVPNPRPVFDILQPMLYYYIELNNLSFDPERETRYRVQYFVIDNKGDTVKTGQQKIKKIIRPDLVEIGGFNVMALPQNGYFLAIHVEDLESGKQATARKSFYVYKGKQVEETEAQFSGEMPEIDEALVLLTKEQLKKEFEMAKYIATRQEERMFKNLDNANAMRKFLTQFWYRRDKMNQTPFGTTRINYLRRVEEANQRFRAMGREGWQTDRGRVLLIYGEPDEIERHPSSMDLLPYVIWYYHNLEGGAEFVFADQRGFGEYELIHSSYRKELQNPNWREIITKKSGLMQQGERF